MAKTQIEAGAGVCGGGRPLHPERIGIDCLNLHGFLLQWRKRHLEILRQIPPSPLRQGAQKTSVYQ